MTAFERLLTQIDAFIRKYYKNEMLKGVLFFVITFLCSWLVVGTLEYFGRFNSTIRLLLLCLFVAVNTTILFRNFLIPLFRLYSIGRRIDRFQAAKIIGSFFPNVSDRLVNTLQLNSTINEEDRSFELVSASVAQRSNELSAVAFVDAVRYDESKRYLRYLIPVLVVITSLLFLVPSLLLDSSSRVVNYEIAQVAPFKFQLVDELGAVNEGESLEVLADITGIYVPEQVYIVTDRGRFLMKQERKNRVGFTLENLKKGGDFYLEAEGYKSEVFHFGVIGKSSMGRLVADLTFPKYLGRKNERFTNVADLDIPEGTTISWLVEAKNVSKVKVNWADTSRTYIGDRLSFSGKYKRSGNLNFVLLNAINGKIDTSTVVVKVIKDAYPSIQVEERIDSLRQSVRSFAGLIGDDYGLSRLTFNYSIAKKNGKSVERSMMVKPVEGVADKFQFSVDFSRENLSVDDVITYFFMVYDNDGVNGSKGMKSSSFVYELPSLSDLNDKRDEVQENAQKSLEELLKQAEKFQKDVDKLQKSLMNKKSDFQTMEQIQQLQQQQQLLKEQLESVQEKIQESAQEKDQLTEMDEELLKQQEMIEKLMEELMDDELKKLLDQLEELMKNNQQNQLKEESQKLDQSSEEMKKQLDRTLEMLKRLQVNEKIDDLEKELKELAEEQQELKEDVENKKLTDEKALEKQEEIDKKFQELKEDMKEMQELNESLERPMNLSDFKQEEEDIQKELDGAEDKLKENKGSKAAEKQEKVAKQMKEMADNLGNQQNASNKKQNEEDMGLLRMLLENLMALSFSQESTMQSFIKVKDNDPVYRKYGRKQRSIIDDTKVVEDSLLALAKRQSKIAGIIDNELGEIKSNFGLIVDEIDEHKRRELSQHQQLVMTSYNNLALLLNESLQNMQQESQSDKDGDGKCDNPGSGKSGKPKPGSGMSSGDMKEMLKKQLDQMKKGPNPGGKQPGNQPGMGNTPGNSGMPGLGNKEIAKMAAQQTAIRQRLEQMRNEMNKEGQGKGNGLNPLIKELEQQEKDLINKNFSPQMIKRQQDILTRLLESEKSMRERGFEEKRESKSGKDEIPSNLIRFDEYNREKLGQIELLKSVDPKLARYYKDKAGQYFNRAQ